jgi:hypothetical protein
MLRAPFVDIALFAGAYVAWVALLMVVNGALLDGRELTWSEYWIIWAIAFAPAALVTALARVMTVPGPGVLLTQYVLALIAIGVAIEVGYVADLGPTGVSIIEVVVSVFIVGMFRRASNV